MSANAPLGLGGLKRKRKQVKSLKEMPHRLRLSGCPPDNFLVSSSTSLQTQPGSPTHLLVLEDFSSQAARVCRTRAPLILTFKQTGDILHFQNNKAFNSGSTEREDGNRYFHSTNKINITNYEHVS